MLNQKLFIIKNHTNDNMSSKTAPRYSTDEMDANWSRLYDELHLGYVFRELKRKNPDKPLPTYIVHKNMDKNTRSLLEEGVIAACYSPVKINKMFIIGDRILYFRDDTLLAGEDERLATKFAEHVDGFASELPEIPPYDAYLAKTLIDKRIEPEVLYRLWDGTKPVDRLMNPNPDIEDLINLRPVDIGTGIGFLLTGEFQKPTTPFTPKHAKIKEFIDSSRYRICGVTDANEFIEIFCHPQVASSLIAAVKRGVKAEFIVDESILEYIGEPQVPSLAYRRENEHKIKELDFETIGTLGMKAMENGNYSVGAYFLELAKEKLDRAQSDGHKAGVLNNLGYAYIMTDEPNKAFETLGSALLFDPNQIYVNQNIGHVYSLMGNYGKAQKHFEKEIDICPENPYVHQRLEGVKRLQSLMKK